jgi:hypothetical protein
MMPNLDGGGGVSDRAFRLLLGTSRAAFVGNMSGQPGPLQLLPSAFFSVDSHGQHWHTALDNGTTFTELYGNSTSPPGLNDVDLELATDIRNDLLQRIEDLADFQAWLGAPLDTDHVLPDTWLIYGTGRQTETRIDFDGPTAQPVVTDMGDGTVPSLSATALGLAQDRQFPVTNLEHATACQHPLVQELTSNILR